MISTDNGDRWEKTKFTNAKITSLAVIENNIFAGTYGKGIYLSTDNGKNWIQKNTGLTNLDVSSLLINGNNIFAGTIYKEGMFRAKLSDFNLSDVEDMINSEKGLNISPNPATNNVSIDIQQNQASDICISIYNSMGIEIKRFDRKELYGIHSRIFSTEDFPSGVYYCIVKSGKNMKAAKFIISK